MRATVSGSFHRHMAEVYSAVHDLQAKGVEVLSPSDPRVVDAHGDFLFVASDKLRSVKLVQDRHFQAIRASDFLLVVCPDGYTGASVSAEIGFAFAMNVPIFSVTAPLDITIRQYVRRVQSLDEAISRATLNRREKPLAPHVLIDPLAAIDRTHALLEELSPVLTGQSGDGRGDAERQYEQTRRALKATFGA